jgi:peptidoglycan hydrolase-like protein with peptidoglycan-binding domain
MLITSWIKFMEFFSMKNKWITFLPRSIFLLIATSLIVAGCSFTTAYEQLAPTDQVELTSEVQRLLQEKGFDPGPVDGMGGAKTLSALEAFQKSRGLPSTNGVNARAYGQLMTLANSQPKSINTEDAQAETVRFISPDQAQKCSYIDQISATAGLSFFGGMEATEESANKRLKVKAAERGANGVRISDRLFDKGRGGYDQTRLTLYGDIYKCSGW